MTNGMQKQSDLLADQFTGSSTSQKKDGTEKKIRPLINIPLPESVIRIMMVILFVTIIAFTLFTLFNMHALTSDPCEYCVEKTGGTCYRSGEWGSNIIFKEEGSGGITDGIK